MKLRTKPRKKQIHPELYVWDYSDRGPLNGGVGFIILYPEPHKNNPHCQKSETMHFNVHWGLKEECVISGEQRDFLLSEGSASFFRFLCELP